MFQHFLFPGSKQFVKDLTSAFKSIKTIVLNKNTRKTSVVLGNEEKVLYGKGFITNMLCGLQFRISPKSFYQINHDQCVVLYNKGIDLLQLKGNETIIDAYCGIGTIGMIAAKNAGKVIGVELNKEGVKDAKKNALLNKVNNISFVCADATEYMKDLASEKKKIDVVILDPTRKGTTKEFIEAVKNLILIKYYIFPGDPETQIRDLKEFKKVGYGGNVLYPVDLFPMTDHVETVVLLSKLHADRHIDVKLEMDEFDLTASESKATYEELKDYILETFKIKVSTLYIAQVKKKCGIDLREHYNVST